MIQEKKKGTLDNFYLWNWLDSNDKWL